MRRNTYNKRRQLSMKCDNIKCTNIALQEGYSIVASDTRDLSEEFIKKSWSLICKELNGGYDERIYQRLIMDDPFVYCGATFYIMNPSKDLISTATVLRTNDDDKAILHMVGTKSDARGSGAAGAVCAACINYAVENGIKSMSLKTDDFRIPAIKIYYKLGFLPVADDDEMRERWHKIAENIGWDNFILISNGEKISVTV